MTGREQKLVMVVPALAVGLGFVLFVARGQQRDLAKAEKQLAALPGQAASQQATERNRLAQAIAADEAKHREAMDAVAGKHRDELARIDREGREAERRTTERVVAAETKARTEGPGPWVLSWNAAMLQVREWQLDAARDRESEAVTAWKQQTSRSNRTRLSRQERLGAMLAKHNLYVVRVADVDGGNDTVDAYKITGFAEIAKKLSELAETTDRKPRLFVFNGEYRQVALLLADLAAEPMLVVPLGLVMIPEERPAGSTPKPHDWALLVWI